MLIAKGVLAHAVLPLALATAGGGLLATVTDMQQRAAQTYAATSTQLRSAMQLDWQPAPLGPRSSGEIACWQRSDRSIRAAEVARDHQGNIYVQDQHSGRLRVLKLRTGFRLNQAEGDWMSDSLLQQARPAHGTL